jgi:hypothetical protein
MKLAATGIWFIGCVAALQSWCGEGQTGPTALTAPTITAIAPSAGPVGTTVTIEGSGFSPTGNIVKLGVGYLSDLTSPDGRRLRFTVPEGHNLCPPSELGFKEPCAGGAYPRVQPGSYPVVVVTRTETSRQVLFTVTER